MKYYKYGMAILIAGLLAGMSSCRIGKKYTRPELNLPAGMRGAETYADTLSLADKKWWDIYTDPVLQSLIGQALEYNKDLLAATSRIKEMMALKRISVANMYPQLSGKIGADREYEKAADGSTEHADGFEAKAVLAWELDLWGNLRWHKEKGTAEYLQSVEARRALEMTVVAEVAQSYFELVALDNELLIVRQTLKARQEGVRLAKLRFEGGLTSETSYQQAQVELARTATLIPELERKVVLKQNEIAFLAGEYPKQIERGIYAVSQKLPQHLPVGLPSDLLMRRPDLRQAEQRLIAANAEVGVAYTNLFPKISLTGQFGFESSSLQRFIQSPYGMISSNLLTPLFAMGKNRAGLKAKRAAFEQECYRYEKSVLTAFKEVDNSITNFYKIKEIRHSRATLEQAARSYVDLAQLQYINGVTNYLDVLDAQRGYFDAQIGLSNAIRDERIAIVHLYKALGGGWENHFLPNGKF